jgi:hypothetical protein
VSRAYISSVQEVPAVENSLDRLFIPEVNEGESDLLLSLPVFPQLDLFHRPESREVVPQRG